MRLIENACRFLKIWTCSLIWLLFQVYSQAQDQPNLIILLADDMGYSDLGCMGSEIKTPNLDRLAKEGVLMTHFYTTSRCCPSRASLMTGNYAHSVGVGHMNHDLGDPHYQGYIGTDIETLPERLGALGYRTLMTGKWHIGDERPHWPLNRGFDRFYGIPAGGGVYFWPPVGLERPVYHGEQLVVPDSSWYSTDAFTDYAIDFIDEAVREGKPFFLYTAYIAPHFPLQAWPGDIDKYAGFYDNGHASVRMQRFTRQQELGVLPEGLQLSTGEYPGWNEVPDPSAEANLMEVYAAMVGRLDQNVGRLVTHLKEIGQFENTLIVFLSDNGGCPNGLNRTPDAPLGGRSSFQAYGQSWANVSNTPYRRYKAMTHEGGLLTPLIASWPEGLPQGLITHEPGHIVDLMATCFHLGQGKPESKGKKHSYGDGFSLWRIWNGRSTAKHREMYWEHQGEKAVRSGNWKLVQPYQGDWELYDLDQDPCELSNLAQVEKNKVMKLKRKYVQWKVRNGVRDWPLR